MNFDTLIFTFASAIVFLAAVCITYISFYIFQDIFISMKSWHGGKGSNQRPTDKSKFDDNYDRIFNKPTLPGKSQQEKRHDHEIIQMLLDQNIIEIVDDSIDIKKPIMTTRWGYNEIFQIRKRHGEYYCYFWETHNNRAIEKSCFLDTAKLVLIENILWKN